MANISTYISAIESASRGEQVRDSIINALKAVNSQGGNASSLDGHSADEYALKTWVNEYVQTQIGNIGTVLDRISGVSI